MHHLPHLNSSAETVVSTAEYYIAKNRIDLHAAIALGRYFDVVDMGHVDDSPAIPYSITYLALSEFVNNELPKWNDADSFKEFCSTSFTLRSLYDRAAATA